MTPLSQPNDRQLLGLLANVFFVRFKCFPSFDRRPRYPPKCMFSSDRV